MIIAYIGLGSNLGNRSANLSQARAYLEAASAIELMRSSSVLEYDPVGGPPQGEYLNQVVEVKTQLGPQDLLIECKLIERKMGRPKDGERWGPRVIDLDVLLYGNDVIQQDGLTIPHPLMRERLFVLEPLAELAPALVHPVLKKPMTTLLGDWQREHDAGGSSRRKHDRVLR